VLPCDVDILRVRSSSLAAIVGMLFDSTEHTNDTAALSGMLRTHNTDSDTLPTKLEVLEALGRRDCAATLLALSFGEPRQIDLTRAGYRVQRDQWRNMAVGSGFTH
jgi:hypothetical protein